MTITAATDEGRWVPSDVSDREWATLAVTVPVMTATMRRYLVELTTFLAPSSVIVADHTLRQLAGRLTEHIEVTTVAARGCGASDRWIRARRR